ncbi:MAG: DinB family protein [Gemmatimonadales bacterium]
MSALAGLPALVLAPLRGRSDAEWQRGPARKWTPAQIVEHLAIGLVWSAEKFRARREREPMQRRRLTPAERIAKFLILAVRWYPQGRKAPEGTVPAADVTRAGAEAHFLAGVAAWEQLERELLPGRRSDLFVKHPRLGDLTLEEWMQFHAAHARHHARQIKRRLAE